MTDLKDHLITNLDHFKDLCRKELLKRAELLKFEDKCFKDDIEREFKEKVNIVIAKDLNNRYNIEDILISLEELNFARLLT
jgi:hypothetical protein